MSAWIEILARSLTRGVMNRIRAEGRRRSKAALRAARRRPVWRPPVTRDINDLGRLDQPTPPRLNTPTRSAFHRINHQP